VPDYARLLRTEASFAGRLAETSNMARPVYPPAEHLEERLYEGGFFPSPADDRRFAAFHTTAPSEKFAIAQSMDDERARLLAGRVIYNEWPRELPADHYARIDGERHARYHQPKAPWTTTDIALTEIAKLQALADPLGSAILDEYRSYLRSLGGADAA
jgi:exodeoxyribonuclease I